MIMFINVSCIIIIIIIFVKKIPKNLLECRSNVYTLSMKPMETICEITQIYKRKTAPQTALINNNGIKYK